MKPAAIVMTKRVAAKILILRNQKVILDADLAELYGVPVKRLNEQIKRNARRFPSDFLFTVTRAEYKNLRSQNATSRLGHGGRRYLPHAFTEHGAIMAATVLNSKRAIEMSIFVVRAFVKMRQALIVNQHVASKLSELEARLDSHDDTIQDLVEAIRELIAPYPRITGESDSSFLRDPEEASPSRGNLRRRNRHSSLQALRDLSVCSPIELCRELS